MQLKRIREEKGISRAELFRMSGVPVRTIEDIEKRDEARVTTALILAKALGVSMDELCAKDEEKQLVD